MYRKVKITKGSSGWGGPLVLEPNETCNKVLCVTGGGIHSNFLPMILPVLCDYLDVNPNLSKKTNSFLRREETIDIEDLKKEKSSFLKFILECDFLAARW